MQSNKSSRAENVKVTGLKVVVGLALDANDDIVWAEGVRLVRGTPHAELHICHVVDDVSRAIESVSDASRESLLDQRQAALLDFVRARLALEPPRGWLRTQVHLGLGKPAEELGQIATDVEADLIVVGAVGGRGLRDVLTGSVVVDLVRSSPCSVSLARPKDMAPEDKTPQVEPPGAPSQETARPRHTYHYRRRLDLRQHDSQVIPTGLPLGS